jgi:hypothetical protein
VFTFLEYLICFLILSLIILKVLRCIIIFLVILMAPCPSASAPDIGPFSVSMDIVGKSFDIGPHFLPEYYRWIFWTQLNEPLIDYGWFRAKISELSTPLGNFSPTGSLRWDPW